MNIKKLRGFKNDEDVKVRDEALPQKQPCNVVNGTGWPLFHYERWEVIQTDAKNKNAAVVFDVIVLAA